MPASRQVTFAITLLYVGAASDLWMPIYWLQGSLGGCHGLPL